MELTEETRWGIIIKWGWRVTNSIKYIFWFLVDVSITNAFIMYKHSVLHPLSYKIFRRELAKSLIGSYNSHKKAVNMVALPLPPPRQVRPESLAHFPVKRPTSSKKGVVRCWYCSHVRRPVQRRDTYWFCLECNLYLCHTGVKSTDCFKAHHAAML